jgi:type I restriction enzyme, S subunit
MKRWPKKPLEQIAELFGGSTPSRNKPAYWNGDIHWVTPTDLPMPDEGISVVSQTKDRITQAGLENSGTVLVPKGTVLFSSRATIGKVAVADMPLTTNQGFANFVPRPEITSQFLAYTLWYYREDISRLSGSTTFKEVSRGTMRKFEIPVPPLAEQEKIVKLLDEADQLRKLRAQSDRRTAEFIPALFHKMFGNPATNPKRWPTRRLRELSVKFSDGPFGSNLKSSHYTPKGVRVIRLQNIGVGCLIDDDKAYVSPEHFESLRKHECLPGDVLVGTLGDPNLRACILPPEIFQALNKADCVQIRPNSQIATNEFICCLLNLPTTLEMASGMIRGQTRARISMGRLAELIVPIPPLSLQKEFTERVKEIRALESAQAQSRTRLDALFASLLDKAFKGEL